MCDPTLTNISRKERFRGGRKKGEEVGCVCCYPHRYGMHIIQSLFAPYVILLLGNRSAKGERWTSTMSFFTRGP